MLAVPRACSTSCGSAIRRPTAWEVGSRRSQIGGLRRVVCQDVLLQFRLVGDIDACALGIEDEGLRHPPIAGVPGAADDPAGDALHLPGKAGTVLEPPGLAEKGQER